MSCRPPGFCPPVYGSPVHPACVGTIGHSDHLPAIRWLRGVGGVVLLAAGTRILWPSVPAGQRVRLWWGVGLALVGLYLISLGFHPR